MLRSWSLLAGVVCLCCASVADARICPPRHGGFRVPRVTACCPVPSFDGPIETLDALPRSKKVMIGDEPVVVYLNPHYDPRTGKLGQRYTNLAPDHRPDDFH